MQRSQRINLLANDISLCNRLDYSGGRNQLRFFNIVIGQLFTSDLDEGETFTYRIVEDMSKINIGLDDDRVDENDAGATVGKVTHNIDDTRFEVNEQGELKLKDGIKRNFD